jgi:hypothetical protein
MPACQAGTGGCCQQCSCCSSLPAQSWQAPCRLQPLAPMGVLLLTRPGYLPCRITPAIRSSPAPQKSGIARPCSSPGP